MNTMRTFETSKRDYIYEAVVRRVIDGDTISLDIDLGFGSWLHDQHVRLAGIDTPETRTKDKEEKKRGLAAKAFVEKHLKPGDAVLLDSREFKDQSGKYGRILGDIAFEHPTLGSMSITHLLEDAGHEK